MELKVRSTADTFNTHHRQGINLSADLETRIDFKKTCSADRFCKGVPKAINPNTITVIGDGFGFIVYLGKI